MERHVKSTGDRMQIGQGILGKGKHGEKHEQILPTCLRRNYPCQEFSSTILYFSTVRLCCWCYPVYAMLLQETRKLIWGEGKKN